MDLEHWMYPIPRVAASGSLKVGSIQSSTHFPAHVNPPISTPPPDSPTEISSMADAELEEVSDFPCILSMRSLSEPDQASASCPAPATGWLARRP